MAGDLLFECWMAWVVLGKTRVISLALRLWPLCNERSRVKTELEKSCMLHFMVITCAEDFTKQFNKYAITLGNGWVWEPETPWNFVLCLEIRARVHEGT